MFLNEKIWYTHKNIYMYGNYTSCFLYRGDIYRRCFHEVTVVKQNCIHFALRFSSLPSLRENKGDMYGKFNFNKL